MNVSSILLVLMNFNLLSQGTSAHCVISAMTMMIMTAKWCCVAAATIGFMQSVRISQVRSCIASNTLTVCSSSVCSSLCASTVSEQMTDRPPSECCHADDMQKNNKPNDLLFRCVADEMYELLSKPESVAYTCTKCTERHPPEWRAALERELQGCIRNVLTALLNSRTSTHLLRYRQVRYTPANRCESLPYCKHFTDQIFIL